MSIFQDKTPMPPETSPDQIGTMLVPSDQRFIRDANYPRYNLMDTHNLEPRKRGCHY